MRVELIEDPRQLPHGGLVEQALNLIALEGVGQDLVEAGFEVNKPPGQVVLAQLWFALAPPGDIDQLNPEAAVAQMKTKIMDHANIIDPHVGQTGRELIENIDHLPARVESPKSAQGDDAAPLSAMGAFRGLDTRGQ